MTKEDVIKVTGQVTKALSNAVFEVEITDENYPKRIIKAHIAGKMRMKFIRVLPGDTVTVELNPYDLEKGRIIYREK